MKDRIIRGRLLSPTLLIVCVFSLQCITHDGQDPGPVKNTLSGKHVLFVYGGWEGHDPPGMRDRYVPWLEAEGAIVTVSNSLDIYQDAGIMQTIDLIIQTWTLGSVTNDQLNGLLNAVRNGTGFAGWHGGVVDAFRNQLDYHLMTGGQFLSHPGGIIPYVVNVTDQTDAIMEGIKDFHVNSEQYYMLTDPNINVLATTTFSADHLPWIAGRTMPVIWKHTYGTGRVFVTTIGHKMDDHTIPEFETTLKRGIAWASR